MVLDKIFVGYDKTQKDAYNVAVKTIQNHSDIEIVKLDLKGLPLYNRPLHEGSTEFSFSRFWVPNLCEYKGYAAFVDCDILVLDDVNKMMQYVEPHNAVTCVQHNYTPKSDVKMDSRKNVSYPRKNWSSVMVFNCAHPLIKHNLTPDKLNNVSGLYLHRMLWAESNSPLAIGSLPLEWNTLSGYYDIDNPKIIHYTDGGPWYNEYKNCQYAELWLNEHEKINISGISR